MKKKKKEKEGFVAGSRPAALQSDHDVSCEDINFHLLLSPPASHCRIETW